MRETPGSGLESVSEVRSNPKSHPVFSTAGCWASAWLFPGTAYSLPDKDRLIPKMSLFFAGFSRAVPTSASCWHPVSPFLRSAVTHPALCMRRQALESWGGGFFHWNTCRFSYCPSRCYSQALGHRACSYSSLVAPVPCKWFLWVRRHPRSGPCRHGGNWARDWVAGTYT